MTKFEYQTTHALPGSLEETLNNFGKDGWQLVFLKEEKERTCLIFERKLVNADEDLLKSLDAFALQRLGL